MELNPIKDAFDRVTKKQKLSSSETQEVINQTTQELEQVLLKLQSTDDQKSILTELNTKWKEITPLSQLEGTQKELNSALTKYPKILEKHFNPDISKTYRNVDFDTQIINQIIANHFYREGLFDVGDCFINEAQEPDAASMKSPFLEMYQILFAMQTRNLAPALNWASTNREKLEANKSDLELKLHRLQFVDILQKGSRDEAFQYARTYLSPFASNHMAEIQKLMTSLLWAGKLDSSPYSDLISPNNWDNLAEELTRQYCNILGQSYESPLSVTIKAGVQGMPRFLKMMNLMAGRKQEWLSMKQLPVPVDLDGEFQFHSIFVCPVSKEQASEENPPMLMSCGHVLCKQSIVKMSKNNTKSFKCPYCPSDLDSMQCKQLHY